MSNHEILRHCAPTLANMKVGNLFTVQAKNKAEILRHIREKNVLFQGKGVFVRLLRWKEKSALIYVYRHNKLKECLKKSEVQVFLKRFGYESFSVEQALSCLEEHLSEEQFPHEIGVFLGYPLEDVEGFILHGGKNFYCTGLWKVYHNPEGAIKTFHQYKKCCRIYLERYAQGFDINRLTVVDYP